MRFPGRCLAASSLLLCVAVAPAARTAEPTEQEQFMIELINRARLDPQAEVVRLGLSSLNEGPPSLGGDPYTIQAGPHQPVAPSPTLTDASELYAAQLNAVDMFCHTCLGTTPEQRMANAGYVASVSDFDFGGVAAYTGKYGLSATMNFVPGRENLAFYGETPSNGKIDHLTQAVADAHAGLFVDNTVPGRGHRCTMMYGEWKEVGVGIDVGTDGSPGNLSDSLYIAVDFARRSDTGPFITGVVYDDLDHDSFYTPDAGEARGGVTVTAYAAGTQNPVGSTSTFASGGYRIQVPIGSYDVRFSGPGIAATVSGVVVAAGPEGLPENTKVDLVPEPGATAVASCAWVALALLRAGRSRTPGA
jgi:serralysin